MGKPVPLGAAALWYAEQGLKVFPLAPGQKLPRKNSHGVKDASSDPDQIKEWWASTPQANIGLATGHLVDVLDIDGPEGQASRSHFWCTDTACREAGNSSHPPAGWEPVCGHDGIFNHIEADCVGKVLTPRRGGMHLYIPATGDHNDAGFKPGVDYRGIGGYVVVPPSQTPQGLYRWLFPLTIS